MKKVQSLFDVDRAFCQACQTDHEKAWMSFMAQKTLMATPKHQDYIDSKEIIEKSIKGIFDLENISFTWEPKHAFISEDQSLGVTTGIYTRTFKHNNQDMVQEGKYSTTWIKENGEWKVVFDIGN